MTIHPENSRLIRLFIAFPLLITSLQIILNDLYVNHVLLNLGVFIISVISVFNSINKSITFDKRGINITPSYYVMDNSWQLTALYAIVALLFNPLYQFEFEYETWAIIGLSTSMIFSLPYLIQKAKEKKAERVRK